MTQIALPRHLCLLLAVLLTEMACSDAEREKLEGSSPVAYRTTPNAGIVETGKAIRLATPERDPIGHITHALRWGWDLVILDYQSFNARVFDERGRYRFSIGRRGDGPGEFRSPESAIVDGQGQLVVRDSDRMMTFDRSGAFVESFLSPVYRGGDVKMVGNDGSLLLSGQLVKADWSADGKGIVHVFDRQGNVIRSLGRLPDLHAPLESVFMSARAGVSAEGVVGWGVMSRPELNLSTDWGRTIETVEIEGLALPDWRRADKQAEEELQAVAFNEWILDFASRFPWLTDISFVQGDPVMSYGVEVDGEDWNLYVIVDLEAGQQARTELTRHRVFWDQDGSGGGWSVWQDDAGEGYAQRVVLEVNCHEC